MRARFTSLIIAGFALCFAAGLVSSSAIEATLRGSASGSLSWGPDLFRGLLALHGTALIAAALVASRRHSSQAAFVAPAPSTGSGLAPSRLAGRHIEPRVITILVLLSAAAFALRLWRLNSCLWFDEVLTLLDFVRPPWGVVVSSFPYQNQHMLYSILAHLSIRLFGESAWALRLPAVLFGVAGIWAVFLLGRSLLGSRDALLACGLMTFSYHHIWFSQDARGYTGLLLFATLATWLWLEAEDRGAWRWWLAYAAALFVGMWVQPVMVFVILAHVLIWAAGGLLGHPARSVPPRKPWAAWLLASTLTLQVYALSLPEFLRAALHEVSLPSQWTSPWWAVSESLRGLHVGLPVAIAALGGALIVAAGLWDIWRSNARVALALILPGLLTAVTIVASGHNLWPRFLFFSLGFALLIVIHGAVVLPRIALALLGREDLHSRLAATAGPALAVLIILASALTVPKCYSFPKQDFIGARDYVERRRAAGDAVVAVGLAGRAYGGYFAPGWQVAQSAAELESIRPARGNVWLVYTLPIEIQAYHRDVWSMIEREFQVERIFPGTLSGGELVVCRRAS